MLDQRTRMALPLALIGAILAVSTSSIIIRFAQREAPSLVIATLRLLFATLLLVPLAWTRHRAALVSLTRREIILGAISGIFLAAHFTTWISSLEYTSVASSAVFVSTGPLWVALVSPALLDERSTRTAMVGLTIAILGGVLIGLSDACAWDGALNCPALGQVMQGRAMWGNFLALVGAWAISGYLIVGRKLRPKMALLPYIFLVYGISTIVLILTMFLMRQSPFGYPVQAYGWILLLAVLPQLIGHSTFNWLLQHLSATMVAVTTLAEPVGSSILAFLFLKETPPIPVIAGGVLILFGIYLASKD